MKIKIKDYLGFLEDKNPYSLLSKCDITKDSEIIEDFEYLSTELKIETCIVDSDIWLDLENKINNKIESHWDNTSRDRNDFHIYKSFRIQHKDGLLYVKIF